jgi:hypothetical protein
VKIQLAPANLHWCSDKALTLLSEASKKYNVPMHMHLLETAYQKRYAWRRGNARHSNTSTASTWWAALTLGHGVWLNEKDIERMATAGACVCHNCSSNFRLRSGVAALNHFEAAGINTASARRGWPQRRPRHAAGDEIGFARTPCARDDRGGRANHKPGLAYGHRGWRQDNAFWQQHRHTGGRQSGRPRTARLETNLLPYLDEETPLLDAVIQRAKVEGVKLTMCDGEVIYQDGKFSKVDRDATLKALHDDLTRALSDDEVERRRLSKALLPHVRKFYANYIDPAKHAPFYRPSSRI